MGKNNKQGAVRIQFDIPEDLWIRMRRYVLRYQDRNSWAHEAVKERIKRMESRDERARAERVAQDEALLRKVVREELRKALEER